MSAKQKVMELIKKKQKQNKAYRTKSAKRLGPKTIVLEFVEEMENLREEVGDNAVEFDSGLLRIAGLLESRILAIDPGANVIVHWNKENDIENWKDLRVDGVTIEWSRFYLGKNPFSDPSRYIDVGSLFLEGFMEGTD